MTGPFRGNFQISPHVSCPLRVTEVDTASGSNIHFDSPNILPLAAVDNEDDLVKRNHLLMRAMISLRRMKGGVKGGS